MKTLICPLPESSWTAHLSAQRTTSVDTNIFKCCQKALRWCQPEVITKVSGKVIKNELKLRYLACNSYFYANRPHFSTDVGVLIKNRLKFYNNKRFLKTHQTSRYLKWFQCQPQMKAILLCRIAFQAFKSLVEQLLVKHAFPHASLRQTAGVLCVSCLPVGSGVCSLFPS